MSNLNHLPMNQRISRLVLYQILKYCPRTVMTYGTTLGDIRTCIVGNTTNMFHDFEGTNLQDKSLNCFTNAMLGQKMDDEDVRRFWHRLFGPDEAFAHINFARNELVHHHPLPHTGRCVTPDCTS